MAGDGTRTVRVRIHGRVQGVGYRAWTAWQADKLGLAGWVRNRLDGTVEALFRGAPGAIEAMLRACHEGPRSARVERVAARDADPNEPIPGDFQQRPTA